MAATCFPYGFPTELSRPHPALGRLWPRCVNAEPGSFGHECGGPAICIGTRIEGGTEACFCAECKEQGHEAWRYGGWLQLAPPSAP